MNENTISSNLTRIKEATDDIRSTLGTPGAAIEDVASDVATLSIEYNQMASDYNDLIIENNQLRQQIADITPKGTISITQNGTVNVGPYASANVNVSGGGGQDPNIRGLIFNNGIDTGWFDDIDNPTGLLICDGTDIESVLNTYDTSLFTCGANMFRRIFTVPESVTNLLTNNMETLSFMFHEAGDGDNLTLNWNTAKTTDMRSMFRSNHYHKITFSGTSPLVTNFDEFCGESDIVAFIAPNLNSSLIGNRSCDFMFIWDRQLQFIDMRSFSWHLMTGGGYRLFDGVPTDCIIVVKDQTEKNWFNQFYPNLTEVKTVAEYEAGDPWVDPGIPGKYEPIPGILSDFNVLDYIVNPYTAWINTNVKLTQPGYRIQLDFMPLDIGSSGSGEEWVFSVYDSGGCRIGPYDGWWNTEGLSECTIEPDISQNGVLVSIDATTESTCDLPLPLFTQCEPNEYPYPDRYCIGRLYYCKIYNPAGTLIRDFIPVQKITTGEIGLFDRANNMFYLSPTGEEFWDSDPEPETAGLTLTIYDQEGYNLIDQAYATITDEDTGDIIWDGIWNCYEPLEGLIVGHNYSVYAEFAGYENTDYITIVSEEEGGNYLDLYLPFTDEVNLYFSIVDEAGNNLDEANIYLYEAGDPSAEIGAFVSEDTVPLPMYQYDQVELEARIECPGYITTTWNDTVTYDMITSVEIIMEPETAGGNE